MQIIATQSYTFLQESCAASATQILVAVAPTVDLPTGSYYYLDIIKPDGTYYETVRVLSHNGNWLTVERGCGSTVAADWPIETPCGVRAGKAMLDDLANLQMSSLGGSTLLARLTGGNSPYDLSTYVPELASVLVCSFLIARSVGIFPARSRAQLTTLTATTLTLDIVKNNSVVGSIVFAANSRTGTFNGSNFSLVDNDILDIKISNPSVCGLRLILCGELN